MYDINSVGLMLGATGIGRILGLMSRFKHVVIISG